MGAQGSFWLSLFTKEHLRGSISSWIRADLEGCCSVTELSRLIYALLKVPVLAPAESCCLIHQGCQWLEQLGCCWEDASDPGTLKYLPWRVESDTLESKCACARFTCRCCWWCGWGTQARWQKTGSWANWCPVLPSVSIWTPLANGICAPSQSLN